MNTDIIGRSLIGGQVAVSNGESFQAVNPATGELLAPDFHQASVDDVRRAGDLAAQASISYRQTTGSERAVFLRTIADEIESLGDQLLNRFVAESGLPRGRAEGERGRTCAQLRLFASLVENDNWADPRIEPSQPDRKPLPKPDTRYLLRPMGPIAVFGPANFPLAFTVAGGDTASALAAGCPVIVKAHTSHPGTSELVGRAIQTAVRLCNRHEGVFSLIFGAGRTVGTALVNHPAIRGVGFTGSKAAGRALFDICNARPTPIPFFGELSSLNPVCLLPAALSAAPAQLAQGLHASVTLGCGQFCTNPGLILYVAGGPEADQFVGQATSLLESTGSAPMLNASTRKSYADGLDRLSRATGVETLVTPAADTGRGSANATPALFRCDAAAFETQAALQEEVFGPATLLVACKDLAEMNRAVGVLEGQLTATVHATQSDLERAGDLLSLLEDRAGRLIFNGWPTGVEVCPSMVHSGPWPATTDGRFTSVGTAAISRWVRPVCWQDAPALALPEALRS